MPNINKLQNIALGLSVPLEVMIFIAFNSENEKLKDEVHKAWYSIITN